METTKTTTAATNLTEAKRERDAARALFLASKPSTRAWRAAAEDLEFWTSKVAFLTHAR